MVLATEEKSTFVTEHSEIWNQYSLQYWPWCTRWMFAFIGIIGVYGYDVRPGPQPIHAIVSPREVLESGTKWGCIDRDECVNNENIYHSGLLGPVM